MALKLVVEQRLERVGLIDFFEATKGTWSALAKKVYYFVKANFPAGAVIRQDDVAETLVHLIQVDDSLTDKLDELKLKQKYWRQDFCDLVVERCWGTITGGN